MFGPATDGGDAIESSFRLHRSFVTVKNGVAIRSKGMAPETCIERRGAGRSHQLELLAGGELPQHERLPFVHPCDVADVLAVRRDCRFDDIAARGDTVHLHPRRCSLMTIEKGDDANDDRNT